MTLILIITAIEIDLFSQKIEDQDKEMSAGRSNN